MCSMRKLPAPGSVLVFDFVKDLTFKGTVSAPTLERFNRVRAVHQSRQHEAGSCQAVAEKFTRQIY